jgi:muramoyltetrapeptide carboxypeptidase LdcA involved in peptidoglycan recycling
MIRVVAPALSRAFVTEHDHSSLIETRFAESGLRITYGEHVDERDDFNSSSVASRVGGPARGVRRPGSDRHPHRDRRDQQQRGFRHTDPRNTFPIGGRVDLTVSAINPLRIADA